MLNYNFRYVEYKKHGYNGRQLFNSVRPSTYLENYRFKPSRSIDTRGAFIGICLIFISLFLGLEAGLFDWAYGLFY